MWPLVRWLLSTPSKYELNHLIYLDLFQALIWKMCGRLSQKKCNMVPSLLRRMCAHRSKLYTAKLRSFLKAESGRDGSASAGWQVRWLVWPSPSGNVCLLFKADIRVESGFVCRGCLSRYVEGLCDHCWRWFLRIPSPALCPLLCLPPCPF